MVEPSEAVGGILAMDEFCYRSGVRFDIGDPAGLYARTKLVQRTTLDLRSTGLYESDRLFYDIGAIPPGGKHEPPQRCVIKLCIRHRPRVVGARSLIVEHRCIWRMHDLISRLAHTPREVNIVA